MDRRVLCQLRTRCARRRLPINTSARWSKHRVHHRRSETNPLPLIIISDGGGRKGNYAEPNPIVPRSDCRSRIVHRRKLSGFPPRSSARARARASFLPAVDALGSIASRECGAARGSAAAGPLDARQFSTKIYELAVHRRERNRARARCQDGSGRNLMAVRRAHAHAAGDMRTAARRSDPRNARATCSGNA
jgi:hypothetical protein